MAAIQHTKTNVTFSNSPNTGFAIEAKAVNKIYVSDNKPNHALKSINVKVPQGSIFGLLGPNGAGKSTFINIMAGTVVKTSGQIKIWGTDIDTEPRQARANIGIVPQELNIDAFFTPRETLDMMAGLFGVPRTERQTNELLEIVGLTDQANIYSRQLSGGMRRRLLVAKAMVHSPPILVLDEPTAGVDVSLRQKLWDSIRALNQAGVTIVLTTHYLEEAQNLCDRIAIINKGEIVASETTTQLLKSTGKKTVHLNIADTLKSPLPNIFDGVEIEYSDTQLSFHYDPRSRNAIDIINQVYDLGIRIIDIKTTEPDLEEIFIHLTKEI